MIREYKPLPFFGWLGVILAIIGVLLAIPIFTAFWRTGQVSRFPTLFGSFFIILMGVQFIVTGIILDVIAKRDRKDFIESSNSLTYMRRH